MKVSDYIGLLEVLMAKHGDLEVMRYNANIEAASAPEPSLQHLKILKGREHKQGFCIGHEEPGRVGEAVIRV